MTVSYEWGPDDGAWRTILDVFALPLGPIPSSLRSAPAFAGANPIKWFAVALVSVFYVSVILLYWLFALIPAASYVFLRLLTLPFFVAVYAVRAARSLGTRGLRADDVTPVPGSASTPATTASEAGPPPRRSTPHPRTSPG